MLIYDNDTLYILYLHPSFLSQRIEIAFNKIYYKFKVEKEKGEPMFNYKSPEARAIILVREEEVNQCLEMR